MDTLEYLSFIRFRKGGNYHNDPLSPNLLYNCYISFSRFGFESRPITVRKTHVQSLFFKNTHISKVGLR